MQEDISSGRLRKAPENFLDQSGIKTVFAEAKFSRTNTLSVGSGLFPIRVPGTKQSFAVGEIFVFLVLLALGPQAAVLAAAGETALGACRTSKRLTSRLLTPAVTALALGSTGWGLQRALGAMKAAGLDGAAWLMAGAAALEALTAGEQAMAAFLKGLDFFVKDLDAATQQHFYLAQLKLAKRHGLPVILHVRRSADRLLREIRRRPGLRGGIAHAFNGSEQQAMAFVERGFKLGFGGALTFDRALQIRRLATHLPAEALVLETDAPDIPPHWLYRTADEREAGHAQGRNEPGELPRIAAELAALRGIGVDELAALCAANARAALPRLAAWMDRAT